VCVNSRFGRRYIGMRQGLIGSIAILGFSLAILGVIDSLV